MLNQKICFIIPVLVAGGAERVMTELINHFTSKKHIECHLILYGKTHEIFYKLPEKIIIHQPLKINSESLRPVLGLKRILFIRKIIQIIQPDVILSFGEYWNNFVLLSLLGLQYPVYVSDRCQPDKSLGYLQDLLRKWLYPKAAGVIAQTEKAKEIYASMFHHPNVTVIGNPIRKIPDKPSIKKEYIVLSVGRLIRSKHHDELIKLFVSLNKPGWKLVIVGDDALKQQNKIRLQALINDLGAQDQVHLVGKRADVEDFYLRSEIFAFTSSSEGFPNVIGEAQAAGLPVVAFDCIAGPSDMITDGENGFLIPLRDYTQFSERLSSLMDDAALRKRLGQAARTTIQQFSVQSIGQKFYEAITSHQPSNSSN